jgi:hypothetical protein
MMKAALARKQSSNFELKNVTVELLPTHRTSHRAFMTIEALEAIRTQRPAVPASRHGLETICGASCETGAQ